VNQAAAIDVERHGASSAPGGADRPMSPVRSRGEIRLGFRVQQGRTRIGSGYQGGCLKFRLPNSAPREAPCAVLLNTSGGLAGGDRLIQRVDWSAGSTAIVTSQAAEKIYRAIDGPATIDTRLHVGAGARAEWLPQESIIFDRARLVRDTQVRLAADADFLGIEAVVLGRTAMDEVVASGLLSDRWRIWREGRLIYADALRLDGRIDELMQRPAIGAGARAMAVIIIARPAAAKLLEPLRLALGGARGTAAASSWNGMTVVRLLAVDGAILRHDVLLALASLREGRAMPRVWSC
jgi:urease accessory protein